MDVTLIQVPFMMGDERWGKGPLRLIEARRGEAGCSRRRCRKRGAD